MSRVNSLDPIKEHKERLPAAVEETAYEFVGPKVSRGYRLPVNYRELTRS